MKIYGSQSATLGPSLFAAVQWWNLADLKEVAKLDRRFILIVKMTHCLSTCNTPIIQVHISNKELSRKDKGYDKISMITV